MNRNDIAWAIARSAFATDMARVEENINDFAARLQGEARKRVNYAARDYAPDMLHVIRRSKINRAIERREAKQALGWSDEQFRLFSQALHGDQDAAFKTLLALPFTETLPVMRSLIDRDMHFILRDDVVKWCADNAKAIAAIDKAQCNSGSK